MGIWTAGSGDDEGLVTWNWSDVTLLLVATILCGEDGRVLSMSPPVSLFLLIRSGCPTLLLPVRVLLIAVGSTTLIDEGVNHL